jgi:capsular exopolysaccharide synthesis family protein
VNDALTKARVQRAVLEARSEQISGLGEAIAKGEPDAEAFEIVNASRTVQELKIRFFDAKVECADMKVKYLGDHPKSAACEAKLAAAREGLLREVGTILAGARREYDEAVQTERKLLKLLNESKTDAFGVNQYEKEDLELKRTHDNNQRLYEMVLQRLKETGVTGMMQMSNVRILDRAEVPESPVRPKAARSIGLAMLFGVIVGVGLALLIEMLDTSITTREQVEERLGLPFLGIIPTIERNNEQAVRDVFVHDNPNSAAAECLRSIRTNLLFMSPDRPLRTILVTSSGPGEGKTTTATSLAEIMADGGSRVLLLDADMRKPRVHQIYSLPKDVGLSSLILGEVGLDAAIKQTSIRNLSVLPCGPIPPNPAELLHTSAFTAILQKLAALFDRVIIDSPPAGVVADAVVISTQVDGTLMVLRAGETSRDAAIRTVRAIHDVNARIFGSVLNDLDLSDQRYGPYYGYYRTYSGTPDVEPAAHG